MKSLFILNLKKLLKNRVLIFWTLLFPIILSTIFHMVFEGIKNKDNFETMKVNYVVDNFKPYDEPFLVDEILKKAEYEKNLEGTNKETIKVFKLKKTTLTEAEADFKNNKTVYLYKENDKFVIKSIKANLSTFVLQGYLDDYSNMIKVSNLLVEESNGTLTFEQALMKHLGSYSYTYYLESGDKTLDYISNYHYTVVAMAIIYGAYLAFEQAKIFRPNSFAFAKRVYVSGASKIKLLISAILTSFLVQVLVVAIFLLVLNFIFKITFTNLGLAILVIILGIVLVNIIGFFLGIVFNKLSQNAATAIIILIGTLGGFLSGMMIPTIKYLINVNMPIISYLNLNSLISDSFVRLDFGNMTKYWLNILSMVIISVVLFTLTMIKFIKEDKI
ncbi:MAG: ABC transporter permease [Acholeplasmataceae bacterium]|jgi:ABC-2 type transport system permease protein|nr:ABC transporter permease [Acholeplasmataceae bacterium]